MSVLEHLAQLRYFAVAVGFLAGIAVFGLLVLLASAVVLRASVAWYNKLTMDRNAAPLQGEAIGFSPNLPNVPSRLAGDTSNPFASPTTAASAPPPAQGVPEPGYLYACVVVLASFVAGAPLIAIFIGIAAAVDSVWITLGLNALSFPLYLLVSAVVLKAMLPTRTLGAAVLIYVLQLAIWVIVGVVLFLAVFVLGALFYVSVRA